MPVITEDTVRMIAEEMSRFTVVKKVRMSQAFFDAAMKSGAIKQSNEDMKFNGLSLEIDNSISTFKVEY